MCRQKTVLNDRDAVCPFFVAHGTHWIRCEGMIPDSVVNIQFFMREKVPNREAKETQYRIFCCDNWQKCERAQAIIRSKYDEQNE